MSTESKTQFERSKSLVSLFEAMSRPHDAEYASVLSNAKSQLEPLECCDEELLALAALHNETCNGAGFLSGAKMVQAAFAEPSDRLIGALMLHNMVRQGLIIRKGDNLADDDTRLEMMSALSPAEFYESHFEFSPILLDHILDLREEAQTEQVVLPYATNVEYLEDWYQRITILTELKESIKFPPMRLLKSRAENVRQNPRYRAHVRQMTARRQVTQEVFPLDELVAEHGLDEFATEVIAFLLRADAHFETVQLSSITEVLATSPSQVDRIRSLLDYQGTLRSTGAIEVEHNAVRLNGHADVELAPHVIDRLHDRIASQNPLDRLLVKQDLLTLVHPTKSMDDVVLPDKILAPLRSATLRYRPDVYRRLVEWGLVQPKSDLKDGEFDEAPLRMLFYGPSGTGKTLTALALANQVGRPVLVTDISKLLNCWVGDSEKNVRRLLDLHSRIVRSVKNPPILFLNECDQLLQRREFGKGGAERMYNQMMALWLEGLENMRGIVIATTNLTDSMDEAFSRRFHLKLEFGMPDSNARELLWRKHLKPTIPLAENVNLSELAETFTFTGGQIAIVVEIAATEAALRGDCVFMEDLVAAANQEDLGTIDHSSRCRGDFGFVKQAS